MKIGFIGGGNMAEAMLKGMMARGSSNIVVSDPTKERRDYLKNTYGVDITPSNTDAVSSSDIIIIAVKPQVIEGVLDEIKESVNEDKTIVSIAAGIPLGLLSSKLKTIKLIRVMPNTPALIQEGISVMSLCDCFPDDDISTVREVLMSIGRVITLPEKYMDAVTALSGSGPGFIAFFVESMIEGGIRAGLSGDDSKTLAIQTILGTSKLLDTGMEPEKLRQMVTSPGGTTAAGLKTFEERGFKETVISAIESAKKRAEELGKSG